MSTTIDEKVVEMRFDNKQFEANVSQSMSTIGKLKKSLNFKDASKSFGELEQASKKVNFSSMENSISDVSQKFSALETMAVGALLRIGSQAVDTGIRLVKSLSVDQIMSGFNEYELKMGSIQTIMASTGASLDEVNQKLDELNTYSDKTIYSFADMTQNIGKFTNAGVDLDLAVAAIQGVSNEAAVSGANANEASRAMYNFAQALSAGYVKLIDWKSIENANMATVEFKTHLLETAVAIGTLTKDADGMYQTLAKGTVLDATHNFNDSLQEQWMTTEVLINTLKDYADETTDIGKKAFAAAQDIKTWTQLLDTVRESVQSGWATTFQLIIGDYEQAKAFFTQLADDFNKIFAGGAEQRNKVLFEGMSFSAEKFAKIVSDVVAEFDGLTDAELDAALAAKGYTREQYEQFKEVDRRIKEGLTDLQAYAEALSPPSGRDNLIQSIYNIRDALFMVDEETGNAIGIIAVLKQAWAEIFPPMTGERIYTITEKIRDFTQSLIPSAETAEKVKNTFKGLFAVLDIGKQFISAIFRTLQPLISEIFGLGDGLLDTTSSLGEWLVKLDESIKEHDVFFSGLQMIVGLLKSAATAIKNFAATVGGKLGLPSFDGMKNSLVELYNTVKSKFQNGGSERIWAFFDRLKEIDDFSFENIQAALKDFKENVIDYFFDFDGAVDGITGKFKAGINQIKGFIDRVKKLDGFSLENIQKVLKDFKDNIFDYFIGSNGVLGKLSELFSTTRDDIKNALEDVAGFTDETAQKAETAFGKVIQFFVNLKDQLFGTAEEIRAKLADKIGFSEIFSIGFSAAMVGFTKKISDALGTIAAPLEGLGSILDGIASQMKASAWEKKTAALKNVAEAILMLVGALAVLTLLDQEKLKSAVGILGVLASGLLMFSLVLGIVSKIGQNKDVLTMAASIVALGASLLMIAGAMAKLDGLKDVGTSLGVVTALLAELLIVSKLMGSKTEKFNAGALSMVGFALSLRILVKSIQDIDKMNIENAKQTVVILLGMIATLGAIAFACKNIKFGAGVGLLAMVVSLKLVVSAIDDLAAIDTKTGMKALKSFITIFGMFAALMLASRLAGKYANQAGSAVLKMSIALGIIVAVFKVMEKLDRTKLEKSKQIIKELLVVFALVTAASLFAGQYATKAGTMLMLMSGALLVLVVVMDLLSSLDPSGLDRALDAVKQLLTVFAVVIAVTGLAGEATKAKATLIILTVDIALLIGAVAALSMLDPQNLQNATLALTILMGALALVVASTHYAEKAIGTLLSLTAVVAALGAVLVLMSYWHVENAIENAAGIGILLTSISASMVIMSRAYTLIPTTIKMLGDLTAVVGLLAVILGLMTYMKVEKPIENAIALGVLLNAMSTSLLILSKAKNVDTTSLGVLAGMTLIAAGVGALLGYLEQLNIAPSIETTEAMSILLLGMSAACWILSKAGQAGWEAALTGLGLFVGIAAAIGGLIYIIHKIVEDYPNAEADIQRVIDILVMVGTGLGEAIGGFIGGFVGGLTDGLPIIGDNLTQFMLNAEGFFKMVRKLDENVLTGALILTDTLVSLSAAEFIDTVMSWFGGGESSVEKFASNLTAFARCIVGFSNIVSGNLDSESVTAAATAGNMLAAMAKHIPRSGGFGEAMAGWNEMDAFGVKLVYFGAYLVAFNDLIKGKIDLDSVKVAACAGDMMATVANKIPRGFGADDIFAGNNDIDRFGEKLVNFGTSLVDFNDAVKGKIDYASIKVAACAGDMMATLADKIPNSSGAVIAFTGDNDIATFGRKLKSFGESMADFSSAVEGKINMESVRSAYWAGEIMIALANGIPKHHAWWTIVGAFTGDVNLEQFGNQVKNYGTAMAGFSEAVSGGIDTNAVESAANAGKIMVQLANIVPTTDGAKSLWNGDNSLANFGYNIKKFGEYMSGFAESIVSVEPSKLSSILSPAYEFIGLIMSVGASLTESDIGLFRTFGSRLNDFGSYLNGYYGSISGISSGTVSGITEQIRSLVDLTTALQGIDTNQLVNFGSALNQLAENGIDEFVNAFSEYGDRITGAVNTLLTQAGDTILQNKSIVTNEMGNVMSGVSEEVSLKSKGVQSAAKTMMGKFAQQIRNGEGEARSAIQRVISSIISSASGYYSKFYSLGQDMTQGLINGANSGSRTLTRTGASLSDKTLKGAQKEADSHSPSKKFEKLGKDMVQGLKIGVEEYTPVARESIKTAVTDMVKEADDAIAKYSPIKTLKAQAEGAFGEVTNYTNSFFGHSSGHAGQSTQQNALAERLDNWAEKVEQTGVVGEHAAGVMHNLADGINEVSNAYSNAYNAYLDYPSVEGFEAIDSYLQEWAVQSGMDVSEYWTNGWLNGSNTMRAQMKNDAARTQNYISSETTAVNGLAASYQQAEEAKVSYYDSSISRINQEYIHLLSHLPEGFAIGLKNEIALAETTVSSSMDHILEVAGKGIDIWEDWLEEKKYYNDISLKEELAGWESLQKEYEEGSEERTKIDREVYRVQSELIEATYQYSLDWIEKEKEYKRLSTEDELAAYERMQSRYMEGSQERMELDKKVFELRDQLVEESYQAEIDWMEEEMFYNRMSTEQQLAYYQKLRNEYAEYGDYVKKINREIYTLQNQLYQESYQKALDWIDEEKYYGRLTLTDELAYYKKIQAQTKKGSDERKKTDREIYRLEQEIYEAQKQYTADVQRVQEEAAQKRLDLEQEYADKVTSINDKLASDIENLNNQYENSLKSRADSLYQSYGLFDEVKEREEVSGQQLLNNLQGQVEEFSEWQQAIGHLSARGVDAELIKELQEMGPSAISQIKALETLTDAELSRYVGLWADKHAMARKEATDELADLRVETQQNIAQLEVEADRELDDYCAVWQTKMEQIDTDANAELDQLRQDFEEKVGIIKKDTEKETQEMVDAVQKIMEEAGWTDTGEQIVDDLTAGVEGNASEFYQALQKMALNGLDVVASVFGSGVNTNALSSALNPIVQAVSGELEPLTTGLVEDMSNSRVMNNTSSLSAMELEHQRRMALAMAGETSSNFNAATTEPQSVAATINIDEIVARLDALHNDMSDMTDAVSNTAIYLDGGALVGQTAPLMDAALGQRQTFTERGI